MNNTKTPAIGAETYKTFKLVDAKIIAAVAWTYESLSLPVTTTWWTSSRITQEWASTRLQDPHHSGKEVHARDREK
jgi:hypothetical protein